MTGAEPFILSGGKQGILLIHGFTGTPAEMTLLAKYLHEKGGYTVLVPRLCGHGTQYEDMEASNWTSWYHSVCDAYCILQQLCDEVSVIGLSMGGLLALNLATQYPVKKVVTLSSPIFIINRGLELLPAFTQSVGKFVPKKRRKFSDQAQQYCISYSKTPLVSVHYLLRGIEATKQQLAKVTMPLLIIQSHNDHTVRGDSANYIYDHVASRQKEICWLEESGHLVVLDLEREKVFEKILKFL